MHESSGFSLMMLREREKETEKKRDASYPAFPGCVAVSVAREEKDGLVRADKSGESPLRDGL